MVDTHGAVLLGRSPAGQAGERPADVLGPSGESISQTSLKAAAEQQRARVAAMVSPGGDRLFPDVAAPPPWAETAPGPELLSALAEADLSELDDRTLVEALRAWERLAAFVQAQQARTMSALAKRPVFDACTNPAEEHDAVRAAASEVSAAVRWTPAYADGRVSDAVTLTDALPATLAALEAGRIDAYKARIIINETAVLAESPALRVKAEAAALRRAEKMTAPRLRAFLRRHILALDAKAAERRRSAARGSRRVDKPCPLGDGMAYMSTYGPVEGLAAFWLAVDAAARARRDSGEYKDENGVPLTLEQLRFDVLSDLGWSALECGHLGCCNPDCSHIGQRLGSRQGRSAAVGVTVPFSTLIGLDEQPAELHGFGPVTAEVARRIAAGGTWRRLLTDPASGSLLDYGTTRYRPPADLTDFVIARDRTCVFATCDVAAEAADIDHTVPAARGGSTSVGNNGPLHRRHHVDKTHHGWRLSQPRPGHYLWISPAHHHYEVEPEPLGVVIEAAIAGYHGSARAAPDPPPF